MKNYFLALFAALFLISCDDGDLIVTDFDFDDNNIETCAGRDDLQVFFKLNNELSNEAIALVFELEPVDEDFLIRELDEPLTIELDDQNFVVYRTFDGEVSADYFCNEVPPTSPNVNEEYRSTTGGEIIINSVRQNTEDHDQDGVPSSVEMAVDAAQTADGYPDSDGDGIPDYLDIDDDNDNVLTSYEVNDVEAEATANGFPDSDGDGIPDYLDTDDDGDEILTRNEVSSENQNPGNNVNEDGLPAYLNPEISDFFPISDTIVRKNDIQVSYRYFVNLENVTLQRQGGDGESITLGNYEFGILNSTTETITYPLEDEDNGEPEDSEEEEDEETEGAD